MNQESSSNFLELPQENSIQQFIKQEEEIYIKDEPLDPEYNIFLDEGGQGQSIVNDSILSTFLTPTEDIFPLPEDSYDFKNEPFSPAPYFDPPMKKKRKRRLRKDETDENIEKIRKKQREYARERRKREKEEDEQMSCDSSASSFYVSKREIRLTKMREYARKKRERETEALLKSQMEKKLLEDRLSVPSSSLDLPRETDEIIKILTAREKRLEKMKRYQERKREQETPEERARNNYLSAIAARERRARTDETDEEWAAKREKMLKKQREYARERIRREKEEEAHLSCDTSGSSYVSKREIRLTKMREYARKKREREAEALLKSQMEKKLLEDRLSVPSSSLDLPMETDENLKLLKAREKRLENMKRYQERKREQETPEERARNNYMSTIAARKRRARTDETDEEWAAKREKMLKKQREYARERLRREKEEEAHLSCDTSGSSYVSKRAIRLAKQREYARKKREAERKLLEDLSMQSSSGDILKRTDDIIELMKAGLPKQELYQEWKRDTREERNTCDTTERAVENKETSRDERTETREAIHN
ncbi:hypothetical protein ACFFRR_004637 [Megaselia abdita]